MGTGELIRAARIERGLTQKQLGELCGMADSAIRFYESGRGNPTQKTLQRIAAALGVSVWDLIESVDYDKETIHKAVQILRAKDQHDKKEVDNAWEILARAKLAGPPITREVLESPYVIKIDEMLDDLESKGYVFSECEAQIIGFFSKLNQSGQQKAVERVEELAEIPRYQAQRPSPAPEGKEGKDTTPAPEGPEGPQEGEK